MLGEAQTAAELAASLVEPDPDGVFHLIDSCPIAQKAQLLKLLGQEAVAQLLDFLGDQAAGAEFSELLKACPLEWLADLLPSADKDLDYLVKLAISLLDCGDDMTASWWCRGPEQNGRN
jgi:hypothetical protein